jgi:competence protein ComEC
VLVGLFLLPAGIGCGRAVLDLGSMEPVQAGPMASTMVLAEDPRPDGGGVRGEARWGSLRVDLEARGSAAGTLRSRHAGEVVLVEGRVRPPTESPWRRWRHVQGVVAVERVDPVSRGGPVARGLNDLRAVLERGLSGLPHDDRALATGLTIGDDRALSDDRVDDLRASGLGHLTAVSGQNVMVVLALLGPLLRRARLGGRAVGAAIALAVLVGVTRGEPSVLRAAMVGVVVLAGATSGRPTSGLRALLLASAVLVLIDPFLVARRGFQLSVAASFGILLTSRPIADRLVGCRVPGVLAEAVAVTTAAQAAVAPVLAAVGDPAPLIGLPANVLAAPGAAVATTWGLAAGIPAGAVSEWFGGWGGERIATVVHLPTWFGARWVAGVGEVAARAPGAWAGWVTLLAVAAGTFLLRRPRGRSNGPERRPWRRMLLLAGFVSVGGIASLTPPAPLLPGLHQVGVGSEVLVGHGAVVVAVDGRADPGRVLRALRRAGVGRPLLVVARSEGSRTEAAVASLRHRYPGVAVLRPGDRAPPTVDLGGSWALLDPEGDRWQVEWVGDAAG